MNMLGPEDFFILQDFEYQKLFTSDEPVWTAFDRMQDCFSDCFKESAPLAAYTGMVEKSLVIHNDEVRTDLEIRHSGPKGTLQVFKNGELLEGAAVILRGAYLSDGTIAIGAGTVVEPGAMIKGPVIIGKNTEVRQGAYIRGECIIGNECVVGHTTEMKGSIMLNGAKAGHFAYIGDSILGNNVNLGAGTKLANLKVIPGNIVIIANKKRYNTGRRKLGAILGDETETGCNSVTSPGTLMGPHSIVYPCVCVPGGYYAKRTLVLPSKGSLRIQSPHQ
jgi:carbonic anhydrase/acetyltransferase-like protein (isoleucine patch superfamily)